MLADEGERLDAVFSLAHEVNVRETLQEVGQFIACRFLVIDNKCVNWHEGTKLFRRSICDRRQAFNGYSV
jgi:hypothetical protein